MKKIVAINCSPRTVWNTATLVKDAAETPESQDWKVNIFHKQVTID